jgi:hypothetical protein
VRVVSGRLDVSGEDVGAVSGGVVVAGGNPAVVDVSGWTTTAWCLALTNPSGDLQTFKFSAQNGLQSGTCSSPTAP